MQLLHRVLGTGGAGCTSIPVCLAAFCERKIQCGRGFHGLARTIFGVCGPSPLLGRFRSRMGLLGVDHVIGDRRQSALVTGVDTKVSTYLRLSVIGGLPSFLLPSSGNGICSCTSYSVAIVSGHLIGIVSFQRGGKVGRPLCYNRLCVSTRGGTLIRTHLRVGPTCIERTASVFVRQGAQG